MIASGLKKRVSKHSEYDYFAIVYYDKRISKSVESSVRR